MDVTGSKQCTDTAKMWKNAKLSDFCRVYPPRGSGTGRASGYALPGACWRVHGSNTGGDRIKEACVVWRITKGKFGAQNFNLKKNNFENSIFFHHLMYRNSKNRFPYSRAITTGFGPLTRIILKLSNSSSQMRAVNLIIGCATGVIPHLYIPHPTTGPGSTIFSQKYHITRAVSQK